MFTKSEEARFQFKASVRYRWTQVKCSKRKCRAFQWERPFTPIILPSNSDTGSWSAVAACYVAGSDEVSFKRIAKMKEFGLLMTTLIHSKASLSFSHSLVSSEVYI